VFRIIVPLDEEYSFDFNIGKNETKSADKIMACFLRTYEGHFGIPDDGLLPQTV
jgi:hypothetical protein